MDNVYDIKAKKNLNFILPMNKIAKKAEKKVCRDTVVIVIHLYYLDTINYYFKYIKNIPEDISVFFTASDYGIKKALENEQIIKKNNWKIIDKQNRGRDISAFLVACRKELLKYEYPESVNLT